MHSICTLRSAFLFNMNNFKMSSKGSKLNVNRIWKLGDTVILWADIYNHLDIINNNKITLPDKI